MFTFIDGYVTDWCAGCPAKIIYVWQGCSDMTGAEKRGGGRGGKGNYAHDYKHES